MTTPADQLDRTIRVTLSGVADGAQAPPIDELAFERRVRGHRVRRRAKVAGVAAAAVVVPLLAVPFLDDLATDAGDGADRTGVADEPTTDAGPAPGGLGTVAFAVEGTLRIQAPDKYGAGAVDTGVQVSDAIAVRSDGVVVVDRDSHVLLVPLDGGDPTYPVGEEPVQWVDGSDDGSLAWIDLDDGFHLWPSDGEPFVGEVVDDRGQGVYDIDGERWLLGDGDQVTVVDGREDPRFEVRNAAAADLAEDTVAVSTDEATLFFDAMSGERRGRTEAGRIGALSPDGRWWVSNPTPEETVEGLARGAYAWDTWTGKSRKLENLDETGPVVDVAWQGDRALVVVETYAAGTVIRSLYSCSVESMQCTYHYEDETGTLTIVR